MPQEIQNRDTSGPILKKLLSDTDAEDETSLVLTFISGARSWEKAEQHCQSLGENIHLIRLDTQQVHAPISSRSGEGSKGAMPPPPPPIKNSHKKDVHQAWQFIFHISWLPLSKVSGSATTSIQKDYLEDIDFYRTHT